MAPNISIREYIRWLPEEASEPTTTLVLTSAENRFVDIRIIKAANDSQPHTQTETVLPFTRLDWAFAGTSSSSIRPDPTDKGKQIVHSQWRHWVDSRSANAEEIVDEGAMFPQLDGTTLESGAMVNPATGRLSEYEECWRDVEAVATEATGTADGEGKAMCAVLVLQDDVNGARGVVVRVGQFVQGILRVGESVSLERWAWRRDGGWIREVKMGDMWLPCGAIMDGQRMRLGGEVRYGDFVWKVVELGEV